MEDLEIDPEKAVFGNVYRNRRVLITGHTGFKGSWLALWLCQLGANVFGYSLQPPTNPNHFELLDMRMSSSIGDIRDFGKVKQAVRECQPEIVFHLAAQPIVRLSYGSPLETLETNVMGTANLFEAVKDGATTRAIVNVTSDKCYAENGLSSGHKEGDELGGFDPYSTSKACSELVTNCWRTSFFTPVEYGAPHQTLLASVRAGNVIGGGDWAVDRLLPDIVRAAQRGQTLKIRQPEAVRPWQHVLEPLSGYLFIGQRLFEGRKEFAEAWNFGPRKEDVATVHNIVAQAQDSWPNFKYEVSQCSDRCHETECLRLDCSKAEMELQWIPVWDRRSSVHRTIRWYRSFYESGSVLSLQDLDTYIRDATKKGVSWIKE